MALNPMYIANSKFCIHVNNDEYIYGEADVFNLERKKSDIMYEMLSYINDGNNGLINTSGLIAIFNDHEGNDENTQFIKIYKYNDYYKSESDYIKNGTKTKGFGFINIRLV